MSQQSGGVRRATAAAYIRLMIGVDPWRTLAAVGLLGSTGLLSGASLMLLVPMLKLVGLEIGGGALHQIAGWFHRVFDALHVRPTLVSILAVYVAIMALSGWLTRTQTILTHALAHNLVTACRQRLFEAVGRTGWAFYSRTRSSDYTHALVTECERIGSATYFLVNFLGSSIVTAVYVALAFKVSWQLTGLVIACGVCLMVPVLRLRRRAAAFGERISGVQARLQSAMSDYLNGMKTVRSFNGVERHIAEFGRLSDDVRATAKGAGGHYATVRYALDMGSVLMLAVIVYAAVEIRHAPAVEILLLLFLFGRIVPQVSTLQQTYLMFVQQLPAFAAVQDLERACREAAEPRPAAATRPVALGDAIDFRRVSFSYGDRPAVRDLTFRIRAGDTTALVGPSGVGKSTIADLVIGLLSPDEGDILVDGKPLSSADTDAWRSRIGYVPQDAVLFHETVRANLLWSNPDARVEDLWEALRLAAADDFVGRLPDGLDTVVGDRGVLVSGGERQRLALARALVRKPDLLVLDEATSSVDLENERRILDAIEQLHGRLTILIITHRLSSVRDADVIHVIDAGRLVESGRWDQLISRPDGRLRALSVIEQEAALNG